MNEERIMNDDLYTKRLLKQWFRHMTLLVVGFIIAAGWFIGVLLATEVESWVAFFALVITPCVLIALLLTCPNQLITIARVRFKHLKLIQKIFY